MTKLTTAACALALGIAWAAAPAIAQETAKDKAERKADRIENQAEKKADQIESDAQRKARETRAKGDAEADRVRGKTDGTSETVGDKMDRAWDKTKAKAQDMKDSVTGDSRDNGRAQGDVRAAQQALRARGFDPGPVDGVMGPRTSAAVREFQEKENLTVTGRIDDETRDRLMVAGSPAASPASEPTTKRQSR
ncbi:MAG TPA: peptidoglycan-binding protein [Methylomirabilota bacterium]